MISFDVIWTRIEENQGEVFRQIRGKLFKYDIRHSAVCPDTVNQQIPSGDFERASALLPLKNTVKVQHLRGPSYIFANLMDKRIRRADW